ncbi:MAG: 50S ribosomal protein L6 [Deltaproteobacteria bacterium]|nr:50S ribosomal protein L6 [Deltaproteobacteria bacterium]MCB9479009.1 50S ribosomal protein L6 [Deltaproteobacteria bacterium]MCB9487783.1 50S ribosomal protein L6 [Deltaproteobacteria bacterium]
MSRIGRQPIELVGGVSADIAGSKVTVRGPKGQLDFQLRDGITVTQDGNVLQVHRASDKREHKSLHGTSRSVIQNMVIGVTQGYEKKMEMVGVGYKAEVKGRDLSLAVGFPKPKTIPIPSGVEVAVDKQTVITITGINKEALGQFAAAVRRVRPPEPYKGKGIKFVGEQILRKVGKTTGK